MHKKNLELFVLCFFVIILYFNKIYFNLEPITWGDWSFGFNNKLKDYFRMPSAWDNSVNGGYPTFINLYYYPMFFLFSLIGLLGFDSSVTTRLFFYWPYPIVSIISMYVFSYYFFKNRKVSFIASFIYSINPYSLVFLSGGHMTVGMGNAYAPLILYFFIKSIREIKLKYVIISGLLSEFVFIYEPRIFFLIFLFLLLPFCLFYSINKKFNLKKLFFNTKVLVGIIFILLLTNFYWILPLIRFGQAELFNFPEGYKQPTWVSALSYSNFYNMFFFVSEFWLSNNWWGVFSERSLPIIYVMSPIFLIMPVLLFLPIYKMKDKKIIFLTILLLISFFLVIAANSPLKFLYILLFLFLPGFNMFRDPSKFYLVYNFAGSILIGFGVMILFKFLKRKLNIKKFGFLFNNYHILWIMLYIVMLLPATLELPYGMFSTHPYSTEKINMKNWLLNNSAPHYKTLWVPDYQHFIMHDSLHPEISLRSYSYFGEYIKRNIENITMFGKLLSPLNVRYIFLSPDEDDYQYSNMKKNDFLKILEKDSSIQKINDNIFENKYAFDLLSLKPNAFYLIGDLGSYIKLLNKTKLNNNVVIFFGETDFVNTDTNVDYYIIDNSSWSADDLILSLVNDSYKTYFWNLAGYLTRNNNILYKDFYPDANYIYGQFSKHGLTKHVGKTILSIKHYVNSSGVYQIWIRGFSGINRGTISFNDAKIVFNSSLNKLKWFYLTKVTLNKGESFQLNLELQGILDLDSVAIVPENIVENIKSKIKQKIINLSEFDNLSNENDVISKLKWYYISPSEYKFIIENASSKLILIFGNNYNPYWRMLINNETYPSIKCYYTLNCFPINISSSYLEGRIYFLPQSYVDLGFLISIVSFIVLLGLLVIL